MEAPPKGPPEARANVSRPIAEHAVLELIARGSELTLTLRQLCIAVELSSPGTACSILLLEEDGIHLRHAAAPSLPEAYSAAIDGITLGPAVGSCGTAAYRRARVIVTDIEHDPLWAGYEPLARSFGLRACASMPIFAGSRLLGTFAIYHGEAGPFREDELLFVESMSVLAAIAVVHDEREKALRKSEERRERAAAILGQIEALVAPDGRWLRVPPMLCGLLARTEEALLASHIQDILHPDDLAADNAPFKRLLRGDVEQWECTSRLLRSDGQRAWASLSFSVASRDERGKPTSLAVFIKDVSEQKRTEETLRATQKMHSLGLLAAGISHDLNNLLAAILANVDLAKMRATPASPMHESLQDAQLVVHRAADLTRQLLAYAGKGNLTARKAVNLNQAIKEVTKMLSTSFLKKIRVTFELHAEPAVIFADVVQMKQVVMNLVINAKEAIGDGDGTILVRTTNERLTEELDQTRFVDSGIGAGEYLLLEVTDTGAGMPPETLRSVFEPFFTTKKTGRGLGLSVVRSILREHRAGLEVTSTVGRGTRFRLYFPAWQGAVSLPCAPASEVLWPAPRGMVLVVDDEAVVRRALVNALQALRYDVLEAEDGQGALLELAKRRSEISLVILDLSMPRMNGRDALAQIRQRWPDLRVLMVTGSPESDVEDLVASGTPVLHKPYGLEELTRAIVGDDRPAPR